MTRPRFPATGQIRCYDGAGREIPCAGSGQDGEWRRGVAAREPRFDIDGGLVRDRLTGLLWTRDANLAGFPLTWAEALAQVAGMNRAHDHGRADWRLPNRRELRSLLCYQSTRPALPAGHPFTNVFPGWYWSATSAAISPAHAWYVHLQGGRMFYGGKDQSFLLWPVCAAGTGLLAVTGQRDCHDQRGGVVPCAGSGQDGETARGRPWPAPRFQYAGEGLFDRLTGLVWRRDADLLHGTVTWAGALAAVRGLNAGEGGAPGAWRLPNINELESLVDCSRHSPALRPLDFWSTASPLSMRRTTSIAGPETWAPCSR